MNGVNKGDNVLYLISLGVPMKDAKQYLRANGVAFSIAPVLYSLKKDAVLHCRPLGSSLRYGISTQLLAGTLEVMLAECGLKFSLMLIFLVSFDLIRKNIHIGCFYYGWHPHNLPLYLPYSYDWSMPHLGRRLVPVSVRTSFLHSSFLVERDKANTTLYLWLLLSKKSS